MYAVEVNSDIGGSCYSSKYEGSSTAVLVVATVMILTGAIVTATEVNEDEQGSVQGRTWLNKVRQVNLHVREPDFQVNRHQWESLYPTYHFVLQTRTLKLRELDKVTHPSPSQLLTVSSLDPLRYSRSRYSRLQYHLSSLNGIIILRLW